MIKVDIISGFLGAGKTTLIRKLIAEEFQHEKIVLIENEYGSVNIDSEFLGDMDISVRELTSGCICCSISGDFGDSLGSIVEWMKPERILIEPSGVGRLTDVLKTIQRSSCKDELQVNSLTAVVDAKRCSSYAENFGDFYLDQISGANCIILSHTDGLDEEDMEECLETIREYNPDANLITAPWKELTGGQIRGIMEAPEALEVMLDEAETMVLSGNMKLGIGASATGMNRGGHTRMTYQNRAAQENTTADDIFSSWGRENIGTYSASDIKMIVEELTKNEQYGLILRAKGIIPDTDGTWTAFDYVPGALDIRKGNPAETGKICVIGRGLKTDKIERLLEEGKENA